jgi:hypothetical protein
MTNELTQDDLLTLLGYLWPRSEDIMEQWDRVDIDVDTLSEEDVCAD